MTIAVIVATTVTIPHITVVAVVAIVAIIPPARIRAATRTVTLGLMRRFRAT